MVEWQKEFKVGKYTFTLMEIRDLLISILVLGFIFSAVLPNFQVEQGTPLVNFALAVFIVGPALLFHELAHKITAQKFGCKAAYVLWPMGVMISILLTVITAGRIIFAALGAVMISTAYSTRLGYRFIGLSMEEMGKIALAGPLVNIAIAVFSYAFIWISPQIVQTMITINLIVALFNTIPFPPLDGSKIFGWSKTGWFGLLASAIILLYMPSIIGIVFSVILAIAVLAITFIVIQLRAPASLTSVFRMP